jgi:ribosomal protein S18 acetylase RimI-like enzyme
MSNPESGESFFAPDTWLARTLAIPTFSLRPPPSVDPRALASQMERVASSGDAFFFARVPAADVPGVAALAAAGFGVVDTQLGFEHAVPVPGPAGIEVGPAAPAERGAVLDIAGSCFRYSRFHQDPRIGREAADRVKRAWAQNCLDGRRGEEVLVARLAGKPTGFLAVLIAPADGGAAAIIDLVGVGVQDQGRGVGAALVAAFVTRWGPRAASLRVGTQAANVASVRLYERCGFRFRSASYVMHAHFRRGRPA